MHVLVLSLFADISTQATTFYLTGSKQHTHTQKGTVKSFKPFILCNDNINNILYLLAAKMHLLGEISTHSFMAASLKRNHYFLHVWFYRFCTVHNMINQSFIHNLSIAAAVCLASSVSVRPFVFLPYAPLFCLSISVHLYSTVCQLVSALMAAPVTSVLV